MQSKLLVVLKSSSSQVLGVSIHCSLFEWILEYEDVHSLMLTILECEHTWSTWTTLKMYCMYRNGA